MTTRTGEPEDPRIGDPIQPQREKVPGRITDYGFVWGPVEVTRAIQHKGTVIMQIKTARCQANGGMQIYVTRTGKVRVFYQGEWKRVERKQRPAKPRKAKYCCEE